jgi:glycosyltransferase involved in cell wall biosynthesis
MSQPAFIIITPSYNQAAFLQQTIDSVLSQKEIRHYYVVDGGSSDASVEILKQYHHPALQWVSKPDRGQTDAINKGLTKVLADTKLTDDTIVAYLNSDDYYLPETFTTVANLFATNPHKKWLVGDAYIVDVTNQQIQKPIRWYKKLWRLFLNQTVLGIVNPIPQPSVFIKLAAIREVGLFTEQLHYVMDYEYWLRLFKTVGDPIITNTTLSAFRIHGQSKGETGFVDQFQEQYQVAKQYIKNPLVLWLQSVHNLLITSVYHVIK